MKVAIVKYNAGNTASVVNALRRLGVEPIITDDREDLETADKVIFPGVGEASTAMQHLRSAGLDTIIRELKQPFLGICLGMQLLCDGSDEGNTRCLGIVPRLVRRFRAGGLKVPHTGWNTVSELKGPLFNGVGDNSYFYFVHGYFFEPGPEMTAMTMYGEQFSSALQFNNFHAVQFHPERSGEAGRKVLGNFLSL